MLMMLFATLKDMVVFEGMINGNYIKLNDVYYSPNINKNLISGTKLAKEGYSREIQDENGNIILFLKIQDHFQQTK